MIETFVFIAAASVTVAVWLALCRRPVDPAEAGRVLSARAKAARKDERSERVAAHIARLQADIEREKARRVAKPSPQFLHDAEGRN